MENFNLIYIYKRNNNVCVNFTYNNRMFESFIEKELTHGILSIDEIFFEISTAFKNTKLYKISLNFSENRMEISSKISKKKNSYPIIEKFEINNYKKINKSEKIIYYNDIFLLFKLNNIGKNIVINNITNLEIFYDNLSNISIVSVDNLYLDTLFVFEPNIKFTNNCELVNYNSLIFYLLYKITNLKIFAINIDLHNNYPNNQVKKSLLFNIKKYCHDNKISLFININSSEFINLILK